MVNVTLNLMIVPNYLPQFYEVITQIGVLYYINIENVQSLIDQTMPHYQSTFDFKSYHSLEIIYNNMDDLAKRYPNKVKIIVGGKTYEKRQIKEVSIFLLRPTIPESSLRVAFTPRNGYRQRLSCIFYISC